MPLPVMSVSADNRDKRTARVFGSGADEIQKGFLVGPRILATNNHVLSVVWRISLSRFSI